MAYPCGGFIYMATNYRLKIDITYTTTGNATTAETNINNAMIAAGRPERATRSGSQVTMMVPGITTQAEAISLRDSLRTAWSSVARSYGKASVVRSDDLD